jgi:resolvase-like protein
MFAVARREIDMIAAWSVDRLGRSLMDLLAFLKDLCAKGVDLFPHQQGLDTPRPRAGRCIRCWAFSPSSSAQWSASASWLGLLAPARMAVSPDGTSARASSPDVQKSAA